MAAQTQKQWSSGSAGQNDKDNVLMFRSLRPTKSDWHESVDDEGMGGRILSIAFVLKEKEKYKATKSSW